jgi:TPR repeat protein
LFATALLRAVDVAPRGMGVGAFPVSFTHAAAWFAQQDDPSKKIVTVLIYFQGDAGWDTQDTKFKWEINKIPATIDMSVGKAEIHVKYWSDSSDVEIQGEKYKLSSSNVFLVEGVDSLSPRVKPIGLHDLSFAADDNPAIVLLRRDPEVWAAISGRPASEHVKIRRASAGKEILSWDDEGLSLLLTGTPDDERKACELFRRAALKGYAASQYRLGYCYESGHGVEQNASTANEWSEKAASQGHVDAQYKLGHSFRVGRGVSTDLPVALQWYKKAAENGDREAMNNVGWMYATGQGVKASPEEAHRWMLCAAQHGETSAQFDVARRLREGDGVSKDLISSYAWLLVLRAQERNFAPADWEQIKTAITSAESQLDKTASAKAQLQAHEWMSTIAKHEIGRFGTQ